MRLTDSSNPPPPTPPCSVVAHLEPPSEQRASQHRDEVASKRCMPTATHNHVHPEPQHIVLQPMTEPPGLHPPNRHSQFQSLRPHPYRANHQNKTTSARRPSHPILKHHHRPTCAVTGLFHDLRIPRALLKACSSTCLAISLSIAAGAIANQARRYTTGTSNNSYAVSPKLRRQPNLHFHRWTRRKTRTRQLGLDTHQ